MQDRFTSPSISWFLLLALCVHFYLLQSEWVRKLALTPPNIAAHFPDKDKTEEPIEVEVLPGGRAVVQTAEALDNPELKDKSAKYLGEFKNRVQEETQAPSKGHFRESQIVRGPKGEGGDEQLDPEGEEAGEEPGAKSPGMADLMIGGASPNVLEGIKKGGDTLLNTDKVLYASFINRIAEQIYDPWVSYCEDAVRIIYHRGARLESNVFVTRLNVVMTDIGDVTSLQVAQSSGVPELDEAPKKAFWSVEGFPNPPKQLVGIDGFIKLSYEFHFEFKNSRFNIVPERI